MPDSGFPELIMSTGDFDGKIQSGLNWKGTFPGGIQGCVWDAKGKTCASLGTGNSTWEVNIYISEGRPLLSVLISLFGITQSFISANLCYWLHVSLTLQAGSSAMFIYGTSELPLNGGLQLSLHQLTKWLPTVSCLDLSVSQYQMVKDIFPASLDSELVSLSQISTFGPISWGQWVVRAERWHGCRVSPLRGRRIVKEVKLSVGTHSEIYLLQWFRWIPGLACYVSITHVYLALRKKKNHHKPSSRRQVWQTIWTPRNLTSFWLVLNPSLLLKPIVFWQFAPKQEGLRLSRKGYYFTFSNIESVIVLAYFSKGVNHCFVALASWKGPWILVGALISVMSRHAHTAVKYFISTKIGLH